MIVMLIKVFLFGIDYAGKTAIVNCLKYGSPKNTKPTLAFNIVNVDFNDFEIQVWDAPGQINLRKMWNNGFNKAKFMIFVLDVNDPNRYIEAMNEFIKVTTDHETKDLPIIFCYHKMDLISSDENLQSAKLSFKKVLSEVKVPYILETSIYKDESMKLLNEKIIQIVKDLKLIN